MTGTPRMLWLELTGRCQLSCGHCYNSSGPDGTHGAMTPEDWRSVVGQAGALGVRMVQMIGGEPTLYPHLADLITTARREGVEVEVYSNLVHVPDHLWDVLSRPGVRLATSFYSDDREQHRQITGRDTMRQTCANILRALANNIPLRAGLVQVLDGQRITEARALLADLGVEEIGQDRARPFGRAAGGDDTESMAGLCGRCGNGSAAILPSGDVVPCIMSRWMVCGNARSEPLAKVFERVAERGREIAAAVPAPSMCGPDNDGQCNPCEPSCNPGCDPSVDIMGRRPTWAHGRR